MVFKFILFVIVLAIGSPMNEIYTFSGKSSLRDWRVVNDGVMGGISNGALVITEAGHGKFTGHVSLANNGGFTSIQLNKTIPLSDEHKFVVLRVKGDGRRYEFRLKASMSQYESYVHQFTTSGEWEELRLPIKDFYPQFRGRRLNLPKFNFAQIAQMSFLIANKQEEDFELLIDYIGLE